MPTTEVLEAFRRALALEAELLTRRPQVTWQQLHNRLQWEGEAVEGLLAGERERQAAVGPWFRTRTPPLESRALLRTLPTRDRFAFSPEGGWLLTLGSGTLHVWDPGTGAAVNEIELWSPTGEAVVVQGFVVSPDAASLVTWSPRGAVTSWDARTGMRRRVLRKDDLGARSPSELEGSRMGPLCAVSPDGALVAAGDDDGLLTVWQSATGAELVSVPVHPGAITACAVSPDASYVVSGGSDGTVRILGLGDGTVRVLEELSGLERGGRGEDLVGPAGLRGFGAALARGMQEAESDEVRYLWDCAIAPDGAFVAAVNGRWIGVWDVSTGRVRWRRAHFGGVKGCAISPDGTYLAAGDGRVLRLWDSTTGEIIATMPGHAELIGACAVSPDGSLIASGPVSQASLARGRGKDGVRLWEASSRGGWESLEGHSERVTSLAFDHSGDLLATTGADNRLIVWSPVSGTPERSLVGHDDVAQDCTFTPDGSRVVSASRDDSVRIWDTRTGEQIRRLRVQDPVWGCAVSPAGDRILIGSGTRPTIWDLETGEPVVNGPVHGDEVWRCAFGPDATWAVTSSRDGTLRVWDAHTGEELTTLVGHEGLVGVCAVSPDGTFVVSGGEDATVRVWPVEDAAKAQVLRGHTGAVWGCAVSRDCRFILSAGWDGTVRAWDVVLSREVARLDLAVGAHGCAFHPHRLLAGFGDLMGGVHVIELMGSEAGPLAVTAHPRNGELAVRCPACRFDTSIPRDELGPTTRCAGCGGALRMTPSVLRPSAGLDTAGKASPPYSEPPVGAGPVGRDERLMQETKTCLACDHEFELLRYACPRCGSTVAAPPSADASAFMQMRQRSASLHVDRGGARFQQGRTDEAEAAFRQAVELNPWNATAHANLGVILLRKDRLEDAIDCFERAVAIDPRVAGGKAMLKRARDQQARASGRKDPERGITRRKGRWRR